MTSKHILIVDDDTCMTEIMETIFDSEGYKVVIANDGLEALEHAKNTSFDVMITDIVMEKMDGVHLITEIRKKTPTLAVFAMTAYAGSKEVSRVMQAGATKVFEKPFDMDEMLQMIDKAVEEISSS